MGRFWVFKVFQLRTRTYRMVKHKGRGEEWTATFDNRSDAGSFPRH